MHIEIGLRLRAHLDFADLVERRTNELLFWVLVQSIANGLCRWLNHEFMPPRTTICLTTQKEEKKYYLNLHQNGVNTQLPMKVKHLGE